jgi:hypothetical protein
VERLDAFLDDLFVRHVARPDRDIGVLIDRLALTKQAVDGGGGIGGLQQRPVGAAPLSSRRAITRASPSLKCASPWVSKISGIDIPAAASISTSASRKGSRNRADSRRPMVDLPAPIMPISTTDRAPSAAAISASWGVAGAGEAVSGIGPYRSKNCRVPRHLYYPHSHRCQRVLHGRREHVGSQVCRFGLISMVNSAPIAFSSELVSSSHEENASKQQPKASPICRVCSAF